MFGYELADILLFDLETLKESYAGYLGDFNLVFYLGLATNLFLIYYIKKSPRVVYALLGLCWIFPGYFFFIRVFEPIFWPSAYYGYLAIAMGLLLIYSALKSRQSLKQVSSQQSSTQPLPLRRMQFAFAGATLLPVLISCFFSPESALALGTSATVAAFASISLYVFQKGWLARTITAVSALWCLIVAIVLWTLVYKV